MKIWLKTIYLALALGFSESFAHSADELKALCRQGIDIFVGASPGSPFDVFARELSKEIQTSLGVSSNVFNRAGAGGSLGAQAALDNTKSCSALVSSDSIITIGEIYKLRFSPETDLVPLAKVARFPMFLAVSIQSEIKNWDEFIQKAKTNQLFYGSPGVAGRPHLVAEYFADSYDFEYTHVPTKGGAELNGMLARNDVQFLVASHNVLPLVNSTPPKAKIIATSSKKHQTDTVVGFKFDIDPWVGVFAAAHSLPGFQEALIDFVSQFAKKESVISTLTNLGYEMSFQKGPELVAYISKESDRWKRLIRKRKIKVE